MGGICRFAEQSAVFENYWADCFPHAWAVPKKTGSPPCKHGYSLSFCNLVSSSPALSHAQNRPIGLTRCFAAILLMRRRSFLYHIIPPMPAPAGAAGVSSLMFATTDSVVSKVEATLVAFCSALLVTFAGSRIPASIIST